MSVPFVPGGADDNLIEGGEMKFVCKPGARNITVIFQPLLRYGHNGEHCSKRTVGRWTRTQAQSFERLLENVVLPHLQYVQQHKAPKESLK